MYFYEVLVSSQRYHGNEPLTYSSESSLRLGEIIKVALGNQIVPGIVVGSVGKPSFPTKLIQGTLTEEPLPPELLELHTWLRTYYPGPSGMITQLFVPSSLTIVPRTTIEDTPPVKPVNLPPLTREQKTVVKELLGHANGSFLLHGDTGTGKTRVYLELAHRTIADGRSAIILTPEIGLTTQLIESFEQIFPGAVHIIHSHQTPAERRNSWLKILRNDKPQIVIGARSALFSPLRNIGLIVLDEAHDNAYKQEQMPYYQATRVAAKLAELHAGRLLLGSGTPLVHDYYAFTAKGKLVLRMKELATQSDHKTQIEVVDLKERGNFSRSPWLSSQLLQSIQDALQNKAQSLVFLNRRGTARIVLCKDCGWQATCPRCDLPLTYHGDHFHLRCHTCGYTDHPPKDCPQCGSTDIQFKSVGTKTITEELSRIFPHASIQRFDSDTSKSDRLEAHYKRIKEGGVDILVGTQILSKGLDLPKLKVVGVVVADTSLYFPDFTAEERTYQMLRQVIGRVGRGHQASRVTIQTYYPESPTMQAVIGNDYEQFYATQLKERELYRFPPFYFLLKIHVERASSSAASRAIHDLTESILQGRFAIEVSGPSPSFVEKSHNKYRWQLIVKAKRRTELVKIVHILPKNCSYDIDPTNLL